MALPSNLMKQKLPLAKLRVLPKTKLGRAIIVGFTSSLFPLLTPHPAHAALFDNFKTFGKAGFTTIATGFGITALTPLTDAFIEMIPFLILILIIAWIIWNAYQGVEAQRQEDTQGVIRHIQLALGAVFIAFATDAIIGVMVV